MAGVMPNKRQSSGRKQWAIHADNTGGSLKRLRSQLAGEGCAESQLVLAKQLLGETCETDEKEENDRLGVYWLMKASEQGNQEATTLLKMCFATSRGVTDHNYLDVKACIEMSQNEKVARRAAREVFATLANGEDFITSQQLERRILTLNRLRVAPDESCISSDDSEDSFDVDDDVVRRDNAEKLSEHQLVTAAVDYSNGELPFINRVLTISIPNPNVLDHVSVFHQAILHPRLALTILYYKLIRFLGRPQLWSAIPSIRNDFQILLLLLIYYTFTTTSLLSVVPIVVYYVSFLVMVISTFQTLETRRNLADFRVWSQLFITYANGELNADEAENHFVTNNLKPYGQYFLALLFNLISYPIVADRIYQCEMTIVAFCLTMMTLLSYRTNLVTFLSFAIHVLAKYPYETDQVAQSWRFQDVDMPTILPYLVGSGLEFCLNFRTFFYVLIPAVLTRMAAMDRWTGTYKVLVPHCVTLGWLQIFIICSQGATMFGLLRATLALVGIICFLPCVGIGMILLPAFALTKWLTHAENLYTVGVFAGLTLVSLILTYVVARTRFGQQYVKIQFLLAFLAALFLVKSHWHQTSSLTIQPYFKSITWDQYESLCHQSAWERNEHKVLTAYQCAELHGLEIEWTGYVRHLRVTSVSNPLARVVEKLTPELGNFLACMFGQRIAEVDESKILGEILKGRRECSLSRYNIYEFEIAVEVSSGLWGKRVEILLEVDDYFRNFTVELKPEDQIAFRGRLDNSKGVVLGGEKVYVMLNGVKCINCSNKDLGDMKLNNFNVATVLNYAFIGFKFVLNVFFNPVLIIK